MSDCLLNRRIARKDLHQQVTRNNRVRFEYLFINLHGSLDCDLVMTWILWIAPRGYPLETELALIAARMEIVKTNDVQSTTSSAQIVAREINLV